MIFEKPPELPRDLAKLSEQETKELCKKIREEIIETVTRNGGHLASNLGVVELTVAMYSVFDPHYDRIIWDVGHQSYVHKILTGREQGMDLLRHPGGVSGFPKRSESDADAFNTGHSSTSISAALGYARAYKASGEARRAVAVIGDGALTGGMAYEALNDAAQSKCNILVVLNDNGMSIDRNVGGLARYLGKVRRRHSYMRAKRDLQKFLMKAPKLGKPIIKGLSAVKNKFKDKITNGKFFENLGYYYLGPVDGHDIFALKMMFERANEIDGPVLLHVETRKGYGYEPAETNPEDYHGVSCFDAETGQAGSGGVSMSKTFADELIKIAEEDLRVVAVTAAMSKGTGLDAFGEKYPDRLFDVGIAEPHAITMSAGMALGGLKPVPVIYSTFLQRAYDQLLHDVSVPAIPMVVGIDRAGLTGFDGETHQGLYDLAYLSTLPDVVIAAPASCEDLRQMLRLAMHVYDAGGSVIPQECRSLFAIRYPAKDRFFHGGADGFIKLPVSYGKGAVVFDTANITEETGRPAAAILSLGEMLEEALVAAERLSDSGIGTRVFDARFLRPLDKKGILEAIKGVNAVVTVEDAILENGFGESVKKLLADEGVKTKLITLAVKNEPVESDSVDDQLKKYGLKADSIVEQVLSGTASDK